MIKVSGLVLSLIEVLDNFLVLGCEAARALRLPRAILATTELTVHIPAFVSAKARVLFDCGQMAGLRHFSGRIGFPDSGQLLFAVLLDKFLFLLVLLLHFPFLVG